MASSSSLSEEPSPIGVHGDIDEMIKILSDPEPRKGRTVESDDDFPLFASQEEEEQFIADKKELAYNGLLQKKIP